MIKPKPLSNRSINLDSLLCNLPPLSLLRMKLQSLNIMNTISQFHKYHSQILRHSQKGLLDRLQMPIFSLISYLRYLYQPLTDICNLLSKLSGNFLTRNRSILNHIMHNTGLNRLQIRF